MSAVNDAQAPIALVIGLCSHGLAMTRALAQHNIEVHAFEANRALPGAVTNSAKIHFINNIKTESLVADLLAFREKMGPERKIVLLPTNDNNVKIIGQNVEILKPHFLISWADCAEEVLSLLLKSNIEQRCIEQGILYPQSFVMESLDDVSTACEQFEFPVIIKPVNPQSGFKALRCDTRDELHRIVERYQNDLPILVQHWITGTDKDLFFGVLYLEQGKIISRFVGNKLESHPPAMGQTTVAINSDHPDILPITEKFFDGLALSGPVSLELKRDHKGRFWVIEPTIGRTDFWVGLCVKANCNLLLTEYEHCLQLPYSANQNYKPVIWFDSERDITAFPRHIAKSLPFAKNRYANAFSYLEYGDIRPFLRAIKRAFFRISKKFLPVEKDVNAGNHKQYQVSVIHSLNDLPPIFNELLEHTSSQAIFTSKAWLDNLIKHVASREGQIRFYCLLNQEGQALAIAPMWLYKKQTYGLEMNWLTSLTNYYSPLYDLCFDENLISRDEALRQILSSIKTDTSYWDVLDVFPIESGVKDDLLQAATSLSIPHFPYWMTKNYYEIIEQDYQSYMMIRPGRVRNTIKRKTKKLDNSHEWDITIYQSDEGLEHAISHYHRIYQESWKHLEPYPEFINGLVKLAADNGWLRLGVLSIEGKPVAAQIWLVANGKAHIYKLAYDSHFRQFSPGTLLTGEMMRQAIDVDKVKKIDFLTGNDNFKNEWMSRSRDLFGIQLINARSIKGCVMLTINVLSQWRKQLMSRMSKT